MAVDNKGIARIGSFLGSRFKRDLPLAPLTTFGIGGPADFFAWVNTKEELLAVAEATGAMGLSLTILGFGSNVLIADKGIRGFVIKLEGEFASLVFRGNGFLEAGAAARMPKMVTELADRGFAGMEPLVGVPGTVGGGIWMNAGTREGEIKDYLDGVEIFSIKEAAFRKLNRWDLSFKYRESSLQKTSDIITAGFFKFPIAINKEEVLNKIKALMRRRRQGQPVDSHNVGSVFKNPTGDFAARLIEAAGLKGTRMGEAVVSDLHANFIINQGRATAADVIALIKKIQESVKARLGVDLRTEVRFLGEF
ncbi:MAG: UDP-N-acetylmuramate dehydrogenase [Elusimicrobia bacterium]|nr:UDP-N-acetylmuramate dehydrogenase [Elusimicrobiota bacterium]